MPKQINIIGDTFCDIVSRVCRLPSEWGIDVLAQSDINIIPGGSCLNTTVHCAHYHCKNLSSTTPLSPSSSSDDGISSNTFIKIFSCYGNDVQGKICNNYIDSHRGLNIINKCITHSNARTGTCVVLSGPSDRSFITSRGCITDMKLNLFDYHELIQCNHLHIAGYYNCTSLIDDIPSLLHDIHINHKDVTVSLNPQYDATGKWDRLQHIAGYLTFLIVNDVELCKIANVTAQVNEIDVESAAQVLLKWGCKHVVVTLGKQGVMLYHYNDENIMVHIHQNALVIDKVIDTTGAGDAFAGGFIASWVTSKDISAALMHGCSAGGGAVTVFGGSQLPPDNYIYALP